MCVGVQMLGLFEALRCGEGQPVYLARGERVFGFVEVYFFPILRAAHVDGLGEAQHSSLQAAPFVVY